MDVRARAISATAVLLLGVTLVRPAAAEPVRLDFRLTLTATSGDMRPLAGSPLGPGDVVRGSLVYDASAPVLRPELPYAEYSPSGSLKLGFGSGVVIPLEGMVVVEPTVINGFIQPAFLVAFGFSFSHPGFESIRAELDFRGDRPGLSLPSSAAELVSRYPHGFLRGAAWQIGVEAPFDSGTQEFFGTVTPVPEPGTLLLACTGAAMLLRRKLRSNDIR